MSGGFAWQPERLTVSDAAEGLKLSTEAGWNQTGADWKYLLTAGQGFGVRAEGHLVASSLALPYPPDFGWVSMVLVTERYRRRGLATLLLRAAVDHLLAHKLVPVLDATPEGRPVYLRMGFEEIDQLDRWQGPGGEAGLAQGEVTPLERYQELDRRAFGADRRNLLGEIALRPGSLYVSNGAGFALARRGRRATQVGPAVAAGPAGPGLVQQLVHAASGQVFVDVPRSSEDLVRFLRETGFTGQRPFHRMALGRNSAFGERELVLAIAGPELG